MNKPSAAVRPTISLFCIIMLLAGCSRREVLLPNNYVLAEKDQGKAFLHNFFGKNYPASELRTFLYSPDGKNITQSPISQFTVYNEHVYGWVHGGGDRFFYLNTLTGYFNMFEHVSQLEEMTDGLNLPRLTMKDSFTYLDIATGYKKPTWTNDNSPSH